MTGTVPRDRHRAPSSAPTDPGRPPAPRPGAPAERLAALLADAAPRTAPGAGAGAAAETRSPLASAGAAGTGGDPPAGADGLPAAAPAHRWETTARTRVPPALLLLATAAVAALAWAVLGPGAPDRGPDGDGDGGNVLAEVGVPAVPTPDAAGTAPDAAAPGAPATVPTTVPTAADGSLHVHVTGEVARPGVVELEPGARVVDAVEAAGGLTGAATDTVNLAAPVTDGQQVLVPDAASAATAPGTAPAGAAAGPSTGSSAGGPDVAEAAVPGGLLNLNTATAADLEALPRVGPVLAGRIVEFRDQHGGFTAAGDLDAVPGIGPALMEALLPLVTV